MNKVFWLTLLLAAIVATAVNIVLIILGTWLCLIGVAGGLLSCWISLGKLESSIKKE